MMFNEKIEQLRGDRQMLQRKLAGALDINTALSCELKRSECHARKKYIPIIAEFLTFWLADRIVKVIEDNRELFGKVLGCGTKYLRR